MIPKLEVATFELTLPSNGKKVKYRPFLVKEHKNLLMTDTQDKSEVTRIVEDIVDVCTFKALNVKSLPIFDIEYIFMNIRGKSIGENVDLVVTCTCSTSLPHSMNIANIKLEKSPDHKTKFMISDTVGVEMKYPRLYDVASALSGNYDQLVDLLLHTIKGIYTSEGEYHEVTIDDRDDLITFINSMNVNQFEKIELFFKTMPKLKYHLSVTCNSCGRINQSTLEDLQNFFV
jgi:hypothetical protein